MKKQFFRVKQLADQTFLRAEKSEVLNHEELQVADQRVDALRSALIAINKKLCPNGPLNDKEKRLKKCLEYQLGTAFIEEAREEKECVLLQKILKISGTTEQDLAKEYAEHEAKVEEMVYTPLQRVIENDLPNILKQKHNLKKYCLDKDSASSRYHSTKKENLKEDMEEADSKVEQSRDALAIEMYHLLARENELSSYVLQLLKLQRGYHESALKSLESIIPKLEQKIGDSSVKKVFGVPLQEHLRVTGRRLAFPLEICVAMLSEFGLSEEGLFRIGGSVVKVKRLKAAIDSGCFSCLIPEYRDVHVLSSTLKSYLRELPEPLLTDYLHNDWMESMHGSENDKIAVVKRLLTRLPQENRDNLAYLIQFLARLADHTENKMSSSNIAIVMAPNLLWNSQEQNVNMGNCVTINMLVELLIKEVNTFFPDEVVGDLSISSLINEDELLTRNGNNGKMAIEHVDATSTESLLDSPRPNTRKKKPAAPVPPSTTISATNPASTNQRDRAAGFEEGYPSGSSTLTRPPKPKDQPSKVKTTVGVNTEENDLSLTRKRSFSKDDIKLMVGGAVNHQASSGGAVATSPSSAIVAQQPANLVNVATEEKSQYRTTVTHHVGQSGEGGNSSQKPVAAPRQSLMVTNDSSSRTASGNGGDFGEVQLRKNVEVTESPQRPIKPEIPARPASLAPVKRSSMDVDPTMQRTQCSVYSVANKQQPSIVNIQNRTEKIQLGHDVMMAEKERFLVQDTPKLVAGHHSPAAPRASLENKFNDINSNKERSRPTSAESARPSVPPKSLTLAAKSGGDKPETGGGTSKSSEKLNELNENRPALRSGLTHARTRSDGNIVDLEHRSGCFTPPSPRNLNKPTEPPPPPPIIRKPEPDSTDF